MAAQQKSKNGRILRIQKAAKKVLSFLKNDNTEKSVREKQAVECALKNNLYVVDTGRQYTVYYETIPLYSFVYTKV